jgi:hypothetical protein
MDLEKLQKEVIPGLIENVMNRMHQMHEDINRLK